MTVVAVVVLWFWVVGAHHRYAGAAVGHLAISEHEHLTCHTSLGWRGGEDLPGIDIDFDFDIMY